MTPEALAALHAQCFPHAPWTAETFEGLLAQRKTRLFAQAEGFLLATVIEPEAEVVMLCVNPAQRRRGVAAALLGAVKAEARTIFLDVAADNAPALALYRAQGFTETGRRRGYYARETGPAVDAVTMCWAITQRAH